LFSESWPVSHSFSEGWPVSHSFSEGWTLSHPFCYSSPVMKQPFKSHSVLSAFIKHNLRYLLTGKLCPPSQHLPQQKFSIPSDFFGICVAGSDNPETCNYIIEHLNKLNIKCLRLDYDYSCSTSFAHQFLARLIEKNFKVCLHIVQPFDEAKAMNTPAAQEKWRSFIRETINSYGDKIEMIEIGSTCNRRKWTGYNLSNFLTAWSIAHEEISGKNITLAGPNVTDFEPLYNIALLGIMKKHNALPDIHSDNLFAERATEPENFDHKILGHFLAPLVKFNTIKKARLLGNISADYGIEKTISTHTAWSLRRIDRILANTEEKQADYVARYCCLTGIAGTLDKVYWGPFVGQREGLIDDGTLEYPEIPHVTFYGKAPGEKDNYRVRKAFDAFKTSIKILSGAYYRKPISTSNGLEIHEFASGDKLMHVAWTTNGNCALTLDCYDEADIATATVISRDGDNLSSCPEIICESPIYLVWPYKHDPKIKQTTRILGNVRIAPGEQTTFKPFSNSEWNGMCTWKKDKALDSESILPEQLEKADNKNVMRDRRNCVWSMDDPRDHSKSIIVKRLQVVKWHKKVLQRFKTSKALRTWNCAQELIRRGINTPRPIAFFQKNKNSELENSYFVYEMFQETGSIRQAFTAFRDGEKDFKGIASDTLYKQLADFLCDMHDRGTFFRDLSAGNILFRVTENDKIEFCLIDTSRAHFYNHPAGMKQRLSDLKRIAH
jgi:hypothetical protein